MMGGRAFARTVVTAMPPLARLSINSAAPMIFMAPSPWDSAKGKRRLPAFVPLPQICQNGKPPKLKKASKGGGKARRGLGRHFVQGDARGKLDQLQTGLELIELAPGVTLEDRKSTRLNSS